MRNLALGIRFLGRVALARVVPCGDRHVSLTAPAAQRMRPTRTATLAQGSSMRHFAPTAALLAIALAPLAAADMTIADIRVSAGVLSQEFKGKSSTTVTDARPERPRSPRFSSAGPDWPATASARMSRPGPSEPTGPPRSSPHGSTGTRPGPRSRRSTRGPACTCGPSSRPLRAAPYGPGTS